ncbi:MAG: hypothetical protein RLZZ229_574 [Actinomycetota bacterium]
MVKGKKHGLAAIALEAGVTAATVSNFINKPHMVSPATKAKIQAAMLKLDFVPNQAASALRKGFNRLIGLIVPEVTNPFYAALAESIADAAAKNGFSVALCVSHDDVESERNLLAQMAQLRAAGVILVPREINEQQLKQIRLVGTHLVLIDRDDSEHRGCSVVIDDVLGGNLAATHLIRNQIAASGLTLVNGKADIQQCFDRREGVRLALSENAKAEESLIELVAEHMTVDAGIEMGKKIAKDNLPRDIFCTNDQLAIGVVRGLRQAGMHVPKDARVVGYGDLDLATEGDVSLTTVAQPTEQMGTLAFEAMMLDIQADRDHSHEAKVLSPVLAIRDSAPAR